MGADATSMNIRHKVLREIKVLGLVTHFFLVWIGTLVLLKTLLLAEYGIDAIGFSKAIIGVLVLAKVVVVLQRVSLGAFVRAHPAWLEVLLRTALYSVGVLVVLLIEKGLDGRHEYGGFGASLAAVLEHVDINHVWANLVCIASALLTFNILDVFRQYLGSEGLVRMFLTNENPMLRDSSGDADGPMLD